MDAQAIRQLEPQLDQFLVQFSDCFAEESEFYGMTYVRGQLSDLERKNVERIALAANLSPRTLQEFLASYEWDHEAMRTRLLRIVAQQHPDRNSIGIIDETSFPKKGKQDASSATTTLWRTGQTGQLFDHCSPQLCRSRFSLFARW